MCIGYVNAMPYYMRLEHPLDFGIFGGGDWKQFLVDTKGLLYFLNSPSVTIFVRLYFYFCMYMHFLMFWMMQIL